MSSHYIVLDKYRDEIVSGSVVRVLFKIGLPLMLFNIVMLLYNIADAYWLSRYSQYAVSIPRQSWPVLMLFNAFIMSFSSANMAIISQYIGARMYDRVNST
ncbi:MAG: MATE family efflux transporter, partial [Desulfurococcaceae archaeon]